MSKSALAKMILIISTMMMNLVIIPRGYGQINSDSHTTAKGSQSAKLITEAATINNQWNYVQVNSVTQNQSFAIRDPECKKVNALEYLDKPETFFQPCISVNDLNPKNYEPIEYLEVPGLDSGLSVTVGNF